MPLATRTDPYEHATNLHTGPRCHEPGVQGYGSLNSKVVFVGISPAREEMKSGRPLTGPSGVLLNSYLESMGMNRADVYCTNIICWFKKELQISDYHACRDRFMAELAEIKPKLIVLMGGIVTEYVLGKKLGGASGARGSVTWMPEFNAYVMPTYHTAAIIQSGNNLEAASGDKGAEVAMDIWRDLSKIKTVIDEWPCDDSLQNVPYAVCQTVEEAQNVLDSLPKLSTGIPVAIDVETSSADEDEMDFTTDQLLCLSVATPDFSWVLPRSVLDGLNWPLNDVKWTMHNGMFDTQVIKEHLGFWMPIVEDTMLQSYSLDERPGYHRLKPLSREYNGSGWWEVERKALKGKLHTLPPAVLHRYNAYDGGNTARLQVKLAARQHTDNVRDMYLQILMPAANTLNKIQYRGVKIDKRQLDIYAFKWGTEVYRREAELVQKAFDFGWPQELGPINLNSPKQVGKMIYGVLSLPVDPRTKKESTDVINLERLAGTHEFIDLLADYRKWEKNYTQYIENLDVHIKKDGKCHSVVKVHGTVTGRLSYTKPALQTIPRPYESFESWARAFRHLRNLFIPEEEDHLVIEADFGKAEIWMAHFYSGDPQIVADLQSGDYHTVVAMNVLDKTKEQVTKDDRVAMKRVTFGIMYGMEANSLSQRIKRSYFEASAYIAGFFNHNKLYAGFQQAIQKQAMQDGELVTITGRKRRFMFLGGDWDNRALKQAINYPIQSTTSDYTLMAVVDLFPLLEPFNAYIMLSVHDSIVVGCPREHVKEVTRIIHTVMTKHRWFGKLPVEIKIGKNWGKAKAVHSCEDPGQCQEADRDGITGHKPTYKFSVVQKLIDGVKEMVAA